MLCSKWTCSRAKQGRLNAQDKDRGRGRGRARGGGWEKKANEVLERTTATAQTKTSSKVDLNITGIVVLESRD